jgi:AraC-like DNA-binding protein
VPSKDSETILSGKAFGLSFVQAVASIHNRNASRITWHQHSMAECLFVIEGSTEYEFNDHRTVNLPGGHFLIIPAFVRHRGVQDVRRPGRLCSIQIDLDAKRTTSIAPFSTMEFRWLGKQLRSALSMSYSMNSELRRLTNAFSDRIGDFDRSQPNLTASLRLLICETLVEAAHQLSQPQTLPPSEAVRAAMHFMNERYSESISMANVSEKIGISRSRLFVNFKSATGMTPNDYLQRLRVSKAAELLKNSHRTITEIAMNCGFSTSQYFSYVFAKYHDMPPKQYRNLHLESLIAGKAKSEPSLGNRKQLNR